MADEKQAQTTGVEQADAAPDNLAVEGIEVVDDKPEEGATETPKPEGDASTKPAPAATEPKPQDTGKTFTEADVQRIVQERVKGAAKAKQIVEHLQKMGWESEDLILAQLEQEVNRQTADKLGVTDVNALRQVIVEEVSKHPVVQQAQQVVQTSEMQRQVTELLKRYPDATDEEIRDAFAHMYQNRLTSLHAAYLDKYAPAIEEKIRRRALDAQQIQAKRGVEGSDEAPATATKPKITATKTAYEWAQRRVEQGEYKSVREALESYQKVLKR
jgi:phosphoglycerate-specific signal transduction histidine kinase